jgi:DNA topoisomerase-1
MEKSETWIVGGRVQSVAVRLICEREKEIEAFKKEKFYTVWSEIGKQNSFRSDLIKIDGKIFINTKIKLFDGDYTYSKSIFKTEEEVKKFVESLDKEFLVEKVSEREFHEHHCRRYHF